jgi:hypothetical protein
MKRVLLLLSLFTCGLSAKSQNIQTLYDFGKDRQHVTTTLEMFKPDKMGNTFFFIDFDYGTPGHEFMSNAYFEIARVMKLGKTTPFGWHGEYNGGFGKVANIDGYFTLNNAWLTGIDYSWNSKDFSKGFSFKVLYKDIQKKQSSFQLTGVWYVNFANNKMSFSGFADFWKEDSDFNFDGVVDATYTFLSEPQLWYNASEHFAFGGEVELSNNFALNEGFIVNPALGIKWTF